MSESPLVPEIRATVEPIFNGVMLEGFGCGIYTLLLVQAVWKLHRKGNKAFYSFILILLWISAIISFACDVSTSISAFVIDNSSPVDSLLSVLHNTQPVLEIIVDTILIIISDGILIWRCNILWRSKVILTVLVTLLVTATALIICGEISLDGRTSVLMASFGLLSSLITTVSTTSLIALKIVLTTRRSRMHHSYSRIVMIVIESGALVSIVLLVVTVFMLVSYFYPYDVSTASGRASYQILFYASNIQGPITGIGPTLIALRVAEEQPQTHANTATRTNQLSRLTFRRTVQNPNDNIQVSRTQLSAMGLSLSDRGEHIETGEDCIDVTHYVPTAQ